MQLFYAPEINTEQQLPAEEAKHCIKILRHKTGDVINVTDGKGFFYECEIESTSNCLLKIIRKEEEKVKSNHILHLAVAPTKNGERTDWMIEKLVEFGIDEITFLSCEHNERNKMNMDRCERIAISAMKQSMKARLPKINNIISFKDFINSSFPEQQTTLIAHCNNSIERIALNEIQDEQKSIICCIGPEGDFSKEEIMLALENGFKGIALGGSRLRTETAAIAVCSFFYFK